MKKRKKKWVSFILKNSEKFLRKKSSKMGQTKQHIEPSQTEHHLSLTKI